MRYLVFGLMVFILLACVSTTPPTIVAPASETSSAIQATAQPTASVPTATPKVASAVQPTPTQIPAPTQASKPTPQITPSSVPQPSPTTRLIVLTPTKMPTVVVIQPTPTKQSSSIQSGHRFVASSLAKKYYYCETDPAWHDLSQKNLIWFDSEEEAKRVTGMVLHAPCR